MYAAVVTVSRVFTIIIIFVSMSHHRRYCSQFNCLLTTSSIGLAMEPSAMTTDARPPLIHAASQYDTLMMQIAVPKPLT